MNYDLEAARLKKDWAENSRWKGIRRGYTAEDVVRLRGSIHIEHTLARRGSEKLWKMLNDEPFVNTLGALTGNQALQQVKAGLKAIYLSGWQVAAETSATVTSINTRTAATARSRAPTRSSTWKARATSTTSPRSSRTPRPASAAC